LKNFDVQVMKAHI